VLATTRAVKHPLERHDIKDSWEIVVRKFHPLDVVTYYFDALLSASPEDVYAAANSAWKKRQKEDEG
jgi:hypothetical protein|tara:strand:+ start:173 stop:373 length:201 start_codon:yes stop_codon:yes gene_type:complete